MFYIKRIWIRNITFCFVFCQKSIGSSYYKLGDFNKALGFYKLAYDTRRQVYVRDAAHPDLAKCLNNIGSAYDCLGDYVHALEYKHKCLEMRKRLHRDEPNGENHPDVAASYANIASTYDCLGDASKAMEYKLRALEIKKSFLKSDKILFDRRKSII